jgi:hypothetical protein
MNTPFFRLAARIDAAWARVGHEPRALAPIAAEALATLDPEVPTSFDALTAWLFEAPALPEQRSRDESFGQPPVTVYLDHRFFIELLFWHAGTTGIHQHAFSGAFRVMCGSSLHTVYDFTATRVIDPRLEVGALVLRRTEVLPAGSVRAILPGRAFIHAAFHLDSPSVTLVVRTHADGSPELEYRPPGLALDPAARDDRTTKLLQLMRGLANGPPEVYRRRLGAALAGGDAYAGAQLLLRACRQTSAESFEALLDGYAARFPELADMLRAAAVEEVRRFAAAGARERITDADQRFFVALLMNLPGRAAILAAVEQRHPGRDPRELVLGWLEACARRERLGFELDHNLLLLARGLLDDWSDDRLRAQLAAPASAVAAGRRALGRVPVLASLFRP